MQMTLPQPTIRKPAALRHNNNNSPLPAEIMVNNPQIVVHATFQIYWFFVACVGTTIWFLPRFSKTISYGQHFLINLLFVGCVINCSITWCNWNPIRSKWIFNGNSGISIWFKRMGIYGITSFISKFIIMWVLIMDFHIIHRY